MKILNALAGASLFALACGAANAADAPGQKQDEA